MVVASLTGGIGSGKTTVIEIFKKKGVKTLNSDEIGHEVLEIERVKRKLIKNFGNEILNGEGVVDRKKLGNLVFKNREKLRILNGILHPEILRELYLKLEEFSKNFDLVIVEIPLLFEVGIQDYFRPVILVFCNMKVQIERLKRDRGVDEDEIERRIKSQMDFSKKIEMSDFSIENNGALHELEKKVDYILKDIKNNLRYWEAISKWKEIKNLF